MKRFFTLAALFTMVLAVSAQGYRKWDFTQWSATTVTNLLEEAAKGQLGGSWSDIEKKDAGATTPGNGVCFWSYGENVIDGELAANGSVIAETAGLIFNPAYVTRRSLALAVDYPSTSLGDYAGPQYLWLGGGNAKSASARLYCFIIPKVRIGQKITMTVESHKPSDARGVALYAGDCTNDDLLIGEQFKPTALASYTWEEGWTLPEGAVANDDGTIDIQVYNTNGCHVYSIEVGTADQKSQVGFLYGGSLDIDFAYQLAKDNDKFTIDPVKAKGALTLDQLTQYDAIIISSTVEDEEAIASLKPIQPFIPTLNLNPSVYTVWEYGTPIQYAGQFVDVKYPKHSLFRDLELIEEEEIVGLNITGANSFMAVNFSETSPFANDLVLATAMGTEDVAIHAHSLDHNGYLYLPMDQVVAANNGNAALLANAISVVANTKAKVTPAPAPTIMLEYKDMATVVTLKSALKNAQVFYTLDGSTPTEQSTLYEEPFTVSQEGVTVKAVALGEGYLLSEVTEKAVDLRRQAAAPSIAVEQSEGKTIVTLSSSIADAAIYYNYDGNRKAANSSKYENPIELTHARTIYAFVEVEDMVASELVSQDISVLNEQVRIDILAHMDANPAEYNNGSTSTAYYFPWGKNKSGENAYPYYNPESMKEDIVTDPETGDEEVIVTYTELNPEVENDFGNGWMLRSRGQIVDWENLSTGNNIGDTSGYNYATADDVNPDFPATKCAIVLADKNTVPTDAPSFPYNAYIVTSNKYAGPFDVVINVASITKPDAAAKHQFVLQTSTDGNVWESNWQTLGDTLTIAESARQTHNMTRSYEGTDEVYVRAYLCGQNSKIGFYDIYIANKGEKSIERMSTGISNANSSVTTATVIYSLNGTRQNALRRGINIVRYNDGSTKKVMMK